jgi:murein DD-endopeptidase MepM/ murein hydrolase activator NlpD
MKAKHPRPARSWLVFAASCGFLAGMLVMAALFVIFPNETRPAALASADPVRQAVAAPPPMAVIEANPLADLKKRNLTLPVQGTDKDDIQDTFNDKRGTSRRHEAIDVLAPRNTPVLAVEDGTIARLFLSDAGGITIYQFDPTETYVYYYAHLERYADGLKEGDDVKRGEVIGYVGTTGNAPPDTPHLHFAIFRMTDKKQWWQGTPIDPYQVLR